MHREQIRAVDSWWRGPPRQDCVFVEHDPNLPGFSGLSIARVRMFFSLKYEDDVLPCALVSWFSTVGDAPCPDTGMWMVEPDFDNTGNRAMSIIHLDTILRSAHLMGVAGNAFIPRHLTYHNSLDAFQKFYVNKYIDHHAHEIAF
jgi:hypothetical protein